MELYSFSPTLPGVTYFKHVGARVAQIRESQELEQTDLAKKAKISVSTLSRLENGRGVPYASTLEKVAKALGTSVQEILGEKSQLPQQDFRDSLQEVREQLRELQIKISQGAADITLQEIKEAFGDKFLHKLRKLASDPISKQLVAKTIDSLYKDLADEET